VHSVGIELGPRPGTVGHYFGLAGLATRRGCDAQSTVTTSTATAVTRLGRARRRIPGDEVGAVSTTARQVTRWGRSRGWRLTEAVSRRRGGGGSGGRRRSEAARKVRWSTVVVEGTCSIRWVRGRWGAKPFGRKRLGGGAHRGWQSAAASAVALQRFHRALGWSCGSKRGGRQWGRLQSQGVRVEAALTGEGKRRCFGQNPVKWRRADDLGRTIGEKWT
jgi:hypothetical protein